MKRIFAAIDISAAVRRKVSAHLENLKAQFPQLRVGWEKPENLHLTLKFLGDIDERQLVKLKDAAQAAARATAKFKLRISGAGVFPHRRKARILWLGAAEEGNLRSLNEIFESECERRGFMRETRDFKAHLTIARLREPEKSTDLAEAHLRESFIADEFEVSEIVIYESELSQHGARYNVVSTHSFEDCAK